MVVEGCRIVEFDTQLKLCYSNEQYRMRSEYPILKYFDLELVSLYSKIWGNGEDQWRTVSSCDDKEMYIFHHPHSETIKQLEAIMPTFFLVYSNRKFVATQQLDYFYQRQEENGAIRSEYRLSDNQPVMARNNAYGVGAPLFPWAEYNIYHRLDGKKRLREIMPTLEKYYHWIEATFKKPNGLYLVPVSLTEMKNRPSVHAKYLLDFNIQMAIFCYYMGQIGSILNDKDVCFRYRKYYFSLKSRINSTMWDEASGFYYDLDAKGQRLDTMSIAAYWSLLAQIPNERRLELLIKKLNDPRFFGTQNPFPTLSVSDTHFSERGNGYRGSVFSPYTFMVIKGLEVYNRYADARTYALSHIYAIIETMRSEKDTLQGMCEAYRPQSRQPASWDSRRRFPRRGFINYIGLAGITLLVENIIGINISLPRKTVQFTVPSLELMGIENFLLKRNRISIQCEKTMRGWEVQLSSEKLYYFTVNIKSFAKKTLPIPSGRCSIIVDKLSPLRSPIP